MINKTIFITGVHHTPAIELINHLQIDPKFSWKIYYLTHRFEADNHLNDRVFRQKNIKIINLNCGKFDRRSIINTLKGIPQIIFALIRSINLINLYQPNIVVSFGGYVSVPVIIAAKIKKIKSIIHEQTLTISLTTKLSSYFVDKIALSFDTKHYLPLSKTIVTGNLIRQQLYQHQQSVFNKYNSQIKKFPLIYITGGNQGSAAINQIVNQSLPKLINFTIIHQTGKNKQIKTNFKHPRYYQFDYISTQDIGWLFKNSSLIIGRSGANTCYEIFVFKQKSILIPLPFAQQNEQLLNAQWLSSKQPKSTIILPQEKLTTTNFVNSILELIKTKTQSNYSIKPNNSHPFFKTFYEMV